MLGAASKAIAAPPHLDALGAATILTDNDLRGNKHMSLDVDGQLIDIEHSKSNNTHYQRAPSRACDIRHSNSKMCLAKRKAMVSFNLRLLVGLE